MVKKKKAFVIFLVVLLCVLIVVMINNNNNRNNDTVGTYCSGIGLSPDDQYISLFSDKTFVIYRQFEMQCTGIYSIKNIGDHLQLQLDYEGKKFTGFFDQNDNITFSDTVVEEPILYQFFRKISEVATLINVEHCFH